MTVPSLRLVLPLLLWACAPAQVKTSEPDHSGGGSLGDDAAPPISDEGDSGDTEGQAGDSGEEQAGGDDTAEHVPVSIDYSQLGPYSTSSSSATLSASCSADVEISAPTTAGEWPRVILAHGFMRGPDQMSGWADHLASWGLEVVVPSLCHATALDSDHALNGSDMITFNAALGGGNVIYAGHSAGALAALIASASDSNAVGLIALDLTDSDSLGLDHVSRVETRAYAMVGEPSSCNGDGNGVSTVSAMDGASQVRITDADHCDFENETDWMCTSFCTGTAERFTDEEIHSTLLGTMTAAAMSLSGVDPDAEFMWWSLGGDYYDALDSSGALSRL